MVDMANLEKRASEESIVYKEEILNWLGGQTTRLMGKRMKAWDVIVPTKYLYAIEGIADEAKIPCCYICNNTFSIGLTYSDLLRHERER